MITTIVMLTWFGYSVADTAVNPASVRHMAPITGVASPGCALLVAGRENELNIAGTCEEVKIKLGLAVK